MIGETVSHYRIVRSLGAGGMGEVYLAEREDAILRVRVADRKVETVLNGQGLNLVNGFLGFWFGSTPDGWPVVLLDAGTHDIYALDWDAP